jgi:Fur family ferric uptake transcriptional regulator
MSHNMTAIAEQLRGAGYRVTPQRQIILDAICALGEHVTAESVYERVQATTPSLNRTTVYRTLHFLTEQHILAATPLLDGRFGYEIAGPEPHHHLVCRRCGHNIDLPHGVLCSLITAIGSQYDFEIDMDHISFFGQCATCRQTDE